MKTIYIFSLLIIFTSCFHQTPEQAFYNTDFSKNFDEISKDFCKFINYRKVILTDIVNYKTLKPTPAGEFLTEFFRNSLVNKCNTSIYQIEIRKKIKINNIGTSAFSRNVNDIKNKQLKSTYLITGTYSMTDNFVIIFVRLINLRTGKIILSKTKKIRYYIKNPFTNDPFDI